MLSKKGDNMKETIDNEMKLEFISKSSNEAFARVAVAAFASQLDPTIEELADMLVEMMATAKEAETVKVYTHKM